MWPSIRRRASAKDYPIAWEDLDGDGDPELVIRELEHNGTCSDRTLVEYIHVRADLSMVRVFVRETEAELCFERRRWDHLDRDVERLGPNKLREVIHLVNRTHTRSKTIGTVEFERTRADEAFQFVGGVGRGSLLTSADMGSDREFVRHWGPIPAPK